MRLVGINAQATFFVGFVFGIIAVEKFYFRVAFKRQNMRGDSVQKPAVMADDDGAAREVFQECETKKTKNCFPVSICV